MKIGKSFTFDAAHRLQNHDGKCKNLHGHTYLVEVTMEGLILDEPSSPAYGMVFDFGDLKDIFQSQVHIYLDHSTILEVGDPLADAIMAYTRKVVTFSWPPTAENLAGWIKEELQNALNAEYGAGQQAFIDSVRVYETPTSWAEG